MIAHNSLCDKHHLLSGATAMAVDFNKFGCLWNIKYGKAIGEAVCVCGFEKAFSAGQLIYSDDLICPVRNDI